MCNIYDLLHRWRGLTGAIGFLLFWTCLPFVHTPLELEFSLIYFKFLCEEGVYS